MGVGVNDMHAHVYVYMCVCMCIYVCVCIYMYVCMCVYAGRNCDRRHANVHVYIYVYMCMFVSVFTQDEIVMGGMVLETNLQEILTAVKEQVLVLFIDLICDGRHGG